MQLLWHVKMTAAMTNIIIHWPDNENMLIWVSITHLISQYFGTTECIYMQQTVAVCGYDKYNASNKCVVTLEH